MKKSYLNIMILIVAIIIILNIFTKSEIKNYILEKIYPKKYEEYVEKYSKEYNIDSLLIFAIIKAESNFNKNAISESQAKGLMQLMDDTAIEVANKLHNLKLKEDIFNPENNIRLGIKYYADLIKLYDNNIVIALAAYNAGIGNVNSWIEKDILKKDGSNIENIPYKETNMYIRKILNNYKMYKIIYNKRS